MKEYYIASCSNGVDSLAMTLRLILEKKPLNEIIFYDTGMEFSAIYSNWSQLKVYAEACGIKCTKLTPSCPFEYKMFDIVVNKGKENEHCGYQWCGGICRWGTTEKIKALDKYCEDRNAYCYIGITADEKNRLAKKKKPYKIHPLAEWEMNKQDCIKFCRERNITWLENGVELYKILDRVSCWCCANKNQWELYNMWRFLPGYWKKLKEYQRRMPRPFKKNYSIFDLEERFVSGYIPKHRKRSKT